MDYFPAVIPLDYSMVILAALYSTARAIRPGIDAGTRILDPLIQTGNRSSRSVNHHFLRSILSTVVME